VRSVLDVTKRAFTVPICSERDFDQKVFAPKGTRRARAGVQIMILRFEL